MSLSDKVCDVYELDLWQWKIVSVHSATPTHKELRRTFSGKERLGLGQMYSLVYWVSSALLTFQCISCIIDTGKLHLTLTNLVAKLVGRDRNCPSWVYLTEIWKAEGKQSTFSPSLGVFWDRVSLPRSGWSQTCNPPTSESLELGIAGSITMLGSSALCPGIPSFMKTATLTEPNPSSLTIS